MEWTDEQINEVLAELGLRTPGEPMPPDPERKVAAALLDCRQHEQELVAEVLEANTKYDRTRTALDSLTPVIAERDGLKDANAMLSAANANLTTDNDTLTAERDRAFSMVRDIEVRVRSLQAQLDKLQPPGQPGGGSP